MAAEGGGSPRHRCGARAAEATADARQSSRPDQGLQRVAVAAGSRAEVSRSRPQHGTHSGAAIARRGSASRWEGPGAAHIRRGGHAQQPAAAAAGFQSPATLVVRIDVREEGATHECSGVGRRRHRRGPHRWHQERTCQIQSSQRKSHHVAWGGPSLDDARVQAAAAAGPCRQQDCRNGERCNCAGRRATIGGAPATAAAEAAGFRSSPGWSHHVAESGPSDDDVRVQKAGGAVPTARAALKSVVARRRAPSGVTWDPAAHNPARTGRAAE